MNELYNKIGGPDMVNRLVDALYDKIIEDPELKPFFDKTDMRVLKTKKRMFLMMILGGPVRYSSKDISTAHSASVKFGLTSQHFRKYIAMLKEVLTDVGVQNTDTIKIIDIAKSYESKVLSGKRNPPMRREIEITSLAQYIEVLSQFNENTLYRGQGSKNWSLTPSIARIELSKNKKLLEQCESWIKLEKEIINRFIRHSHPHLKYVPDSYIEWLVLGQHHGLPTRLLDWSQNPLVSLYFALSTPTTDDSLVVAMDPKFVYNIDIDLDQLEQVQVYFPRNIDSKLVSQKGCFTIQPLPKGTDSFLPLDADMNVLSMCSHSFSKIIIPGNQKIKRDILINLANNGIDETFIYPDLYGLSRQIKRDIEIGLIRF